MRGDNPGGMQRRPAMSIRSFRQRSAATSGIVSPILHAMPRIPERTGTSCHGRAGEDIIGMPGDFPTAAA